MKKFKCVSFLIILMGANSLAYAQYFNLEPQDGPQNLLGLKITNPLFKSTEDSYQVSGWSGVYTINGLFSFKNDWGMYCEIPIIVAKNDYVKENGLGNIFVTVRKDLNESKTSRISFGAYLPTMGKEKYLKREIGLISSIYRLPQFIEGVTLYGNFSHYLPQEKKGLFGFEIGPDIAIPTNEGDTELLIHFGIKGGYRLSRLLLWSEFSGIGIMTESEVDFGDRIASQLGFGGQLDVGKVDLGVFYSIPFKDYVREVANGILGLKVGVEI